MVDRPQPHYNAENISNRLHAANRVRLRMWSQQKTDSHIQTMPGLSIHGIVYSRHTRVTARNSCTYWAYKSRWGCSSVGKKRLPCVTVAFLITRISMASSHRHTGACRR